MLHRSAHADQRRLEALNSHVTCGYSLLDFPDAPIRFDSNPLYSTRSLHSLSIASYPSKTSQFSASFFPSSTKLWNSLSYDVVSYLAFGLLKKVPNLNFCAVCYCILIILV